MVPTVDAGFEIDGPMEVRISAEPEPPGQSIKNLVGNAMEHGEGTVTIRVDLLSTGDGCHVEDDGAGSSKTDASRCSKKATPRTEECGFG